MYEVTLEQRLALIELKLYNDNKQACIADDVKNFLKSGYIAMDASGNWHWYQEKPVRTERGWLTYSSRTHTLEPINLIRAVCWEDSLMEV